MKKILIFILLLKFSYAQNQNRNWYFGNGTDGIIFDSQNAPVKVNNKYPGVGFEGMAVASDPCSGSLLFYTDGIKVIDKNHNLMLNGTGLLSNLSGSQCVQICKVPGNCNQYYIISNSSWDDTPGSFYYSIVDFSSNPLGQVTIKNQFINGPDYHQAMRIVPKTNSNNYWLIGHLYNTATYHVLEITPSGFMGPVVYNFANSGRSWTMEYNETTHKLLNMGQDDLNVSLFDFNPVTGVLSNEQQLYFGAMDAYIGNFSPDGSKIYVGLGSNVLDLWQYDINNNIWTNMNTCCWAHDIKTGPNGITYFINTYNGANPLSKMTNANLTAVGNACGYSPIASPGNFNGEVRRFPEFLQIPDPPVANLDLVSFTGGSILINPLTNDYDPQSDAFSLTGIFSGPSNGTVIINGNQITYFPFSGICNGTDTITYMITDVSCMCDTAQIIINFLGVNPVSSFSFVQSCNGTVTFNNQSLNATTFTWDFGDSSRLQSVINPTYNYIVSGSYTVKLIALNACNSDTFILNLSVNVINPALAVFSSLQQSCSLLLNFTNQSQNGASYAWDFGDGFLETNYNTSHTYLISGSYFVTLIVSNTCSSDTLTKQISVNDIPDFHAEYLYEAGICTNTINFTDQSLNSVSSFWDFGDGNFSTLIYPSHTYLVSGIYNVILISNGKCAADTVFFVVNNSFSVGVASFEIIQQPCETQIQFLNQSLNSYSVFWDFGDGFEDHSSNPIHSYFSGGEYVVELYINQGTQCFDSAEMTIKVHDPVITSLYVPNCFTPNNDGKNELFEIYGTIDCESYQLYIYNRWGSLVYKTDDIWKFWDGKMNGNEVREGVYAYLIIGKNFLKNGSVSLIR